ncbi:hypothetical protein DFH27DRAFT_392217 [Peziza echinospora]|nr:hypothetical protein DFH27DRAFT_392217 [Peziza echinospora]
MAISRSHDPAASASHPHGTQQTRSPPTALPISMGAWSMPFCDFLPSACLCLPLPASACLQLHASHEAAIHSIHPSIHPSSPSSHPASPAQPATIEPANQHVCAVPSYWPKDSVNLSARATARMIDGGEYLVGSLVAWARAIAGGLGGPWASVSSGHSSRRCRWVMTDCDRAGTTDWQRGRASDPRDRCSCFGAVDKWAEAESAECVYYGPLCLAHPPAHRHISRSARYWPCN